MPVPYSQFFWSVFSRIWTKYGEIRSEYAENVESKNSKYGHFLRRGNREKKIHCRLGCIQLYNGDTFVWKEITLLTYKYILRNSRGLFVQALFLRLFSFKICSPGHPFKILRFEKQNSGFDYVLLSCHIRLYSESRLCNHLNVKKLLGWNRRDTRIPLQPVKFWISLK